MDYDAIGRWRTHEQISEGLRENPTVDASGKLADGRAFSGSDEFKHLMAEDRDTLAQIFWNTSLFGTTTYVLGRTMTTGDRKQIKAIATMYRPEGHRLKSMIEPLVMSNFFLKR